MLATRWLRSSSWAHAGVGQVERRGDAIDILAHALDQRLQGEQFVHLALEGPGGLVAPRQPLLGVTLGLAQARQFLLRAADLLERVTHGVLGAAEHAEVAHGGLDRGAGVLDLLHPEAEAGQQLFEPGRLGLEQSRALRLLPSALNSVVSPETWA